MKRLADFHYTGVPRLGTVLFSAMTMTRLQEARIGTAELEDTLQQGADTKDRTQPHSGWRELNGVRLVLRTRPHLKGAAVVCIDGYRVKP